jgi:hypothetical protein
MAICDFPRDRRLTSLWFVDNYRLKAKAFSLAQEMREACKD